jgi:hypothetical protein
MGKAVQDRPGGSRPGRIQAKVAGQQAAQAAQRAQARRRLAIAGSSVLAVLALVAVLIGVKLTQKQSSAGPEASAATAAAVSRQVTGVPASTFRAVGRGTAAKVTPVSGPPLLTSGGKPEVLYMGGEFCPYCAAERWALAAAVSRFGHLSGLRFIHSSPDDYAPSTPTLSFTGARYTSKYLAFVPVEWLGERAAPTPFGHVYLQHPTAQQKALWSRLAHGAIPFVDIGNKFVVSGSQYLPTALAGMSWAQVAAAMHDPSSPVARDIDGAANQLTAAICTLTHGQPGGVCSASS